jgi:Rrf2 family protein
MRLEVTRKSDLAVRALQTLGASTGRMKGPVLAEAVGSTPGFVAQVVTPLIRQGWVRSDPGPSGGYSLAVALDAVSVLAVIEAIEGPTATGRCVLADRPCNETGTCALHVPWLSAQSQLLGELAATPVAGVSRGGVTVPGPQGQKHRSPKGD